VTGVGEEHGGGVTLWSVGLGSSSPGIAQSFCWASSLCAEDALGTCWLCSFPSSLSPREARGDVPRVQCLLCRSILGGRWSLHTGLRRGLWICSQRRHPGPDGLRPWLSPQLDSSVLPGKVWKQHRTVPFPHGRATNSG
jgi:hypothetical protein